jgi:hypothetical protein
MRMLGSLKLEKPWMYVYPNNADPLCFGGPIHNDAVA